MENDETQPVSEVMNGDEAAVFLKMPKSTLLKLCSEGQLPGVKVGRQWRFHRDALENWRREKAGEESSDLPEAPAEGFGQSLASAEARLEREIKPVVNEVIGSVGEEDFDSVGDVIDLDESGTTGQPVPLEETVDKPVAKTGRKAPAKPSALELMAEISERSSGRKSTKTSRARAATAPKAASPAPAPKPVLEKREEPEAVEVSRPYNKPPAVAPSRPAPAPRKQGGGAGALKNLFYGVVVVGVLVLAGFGVKSILIPPQMATPSGADAPKAPYVPPLPEFQVVYKHNEPDEPRDDTFKVPATPQPTPAVLADAAPLQATGPALTAPPQEIAAPAPSMPINVPPPANPNLDSINRLLPGLFDLSGCAITSNNNEIRIKFQDGLFASGVKLDRAGRERLTRVAQFLSANAPDFYVIIEGQTDGQPLRANSMFRDNYNLGFQRAITATEVMRSEAGFPAERLLASSAGGSPPPFAKDQPNAAQKNRTVVLRLIPKTGSIPASQSE